MKPVFEPHRSGKGGSGDGAAFFYRVLTARRLADAGSLTDIGEHLIAHKPFSLAELARKLSRTLAGP